MGPLLRSVIMNEIPVAGMLFKLITEILRCEAAVHRRMSGWRGLWLIRKHLMLESKLADAKAEMHEAKLAAVMGAASKEEFEASRFCVENIERKLRMNDQKIRRFLWGLDEYIALLKQQYSYLLKIAQRDADDDDDGSTVMPYLHVIKDDREESDPSPQDLDDLMRTVPLWGPSPDDSFMN